MAGAKDDPGLAEVKAVLSKLQRLDPAAGPGLESPDQGPVRGEDHPQRAAMSGAISVFDRKRAAAAAADLKAARRPHFAAYGFGTGLVIATAVFLFAAGIVEVPRHMPFGFHQLGFSQARDKEREGALLAEARKDLSEGNITLARTRLLAGEPGRRAEVAFVLAQSYDPNYLTSLPRANSRPDPQEAARWYKKWYELAVQSGLEMDSGRLQRIINAMH